MKYVIKIWESKQIKFPHRHIQSCCRVHWQVHILQLGPDNADVPIWAIPSEVLPHMLTALTQVPKPEAPALQDIKHGPWMGRTTIAVSYWDELALTSAPRQVPWQPREPSAPQEMTSQSSSLFYMQDPLNDDLCQTHLVLLSPNKSLFVFI